MDFKMRWIEFNNKSPKPYKGVSPKPTYTEMFQKDMFWCGYEIDFKAGDKNQIELFLYYCALVLNYDLCTVDIEDRHGNLMYVEQDFKIGEYEKFIKKTQRLNHNG